MDTGILQDRCVTAEDRAVHETQGMGWEKVGRP